MNTRFGSATVSLPSDLEIVIQRVFDAPAAVVFEVWTSPEYVRRWWSGEDAQLVVCDIDLRVGGSWRYVTRDGDGIELGWHGTYRAIEPPRRLVSTEVFEDYPEGEALDTLARQLRDPDGLVRFGALQSLMSAPVDIRAQLVEPALSDPLRALRTD